MAINYAKSYQKELANQYGTAMYLGALFTSPNNQKYKELKGDTIELPVLKTKGRIDGNMDSIGTIGKNHSLEWEPKKLTNYREFTTLVHPAEVDMTNEVTTINNIANTFNAEQKIPEKQAYAVSKLYSDWTAQTNTANNLELTVDNVLSIIDTIAEQMDDARVPASGRMLYVIPTVVTLINNAKRKMLTVTSRAEEFSLVSVPSDLMKTAYDFTEGYKPGVSAKQITMFAVHPLSVLTPEIYSAVTLDQPSAKSKGMYVYFEGAYEDVFILNERTKGLAFAVAEPKVANEEA